jgi:hypothetical protein
MVDPGLAPATPRMQRGDARRAQRQDETMEFMGSPFEHGEKPDAEAMLRMQRRMSEPDNEVPAPVPFTAVLGRTDDVAVCIADMHAYTTGLSFRLAVRLRQMRPGLHHRIFDMVSGREPGTPDGDRLLLGVECADGRTASNIAGDDWFAMHELPDDQVVLTPGGGSGGGPGARDARKQLLRPRLQRRKSPPTIRAGPECATACRVPAATSSQKSFPAVSRISARPLVPS